MMKSTAKKNSTTRKAAIAILVCAAFGMAACEQAAAQSDDGCSVNVNYEIDCGPGDPGPTLAGG